jgi:hypothetical protein
VPANRCGQAERQKACSTGICRATAARHTHVIHVCELMQETMAGDRIVLFQPNDTRQAIPLPLSSLRPDKFLGKGSGGVVRLISTDARDLAV